jgi:hypothetical protein
MRGSNWKLALIVATALFCSSVRAQEKCPVEVKLLLSPQTAQTVISSLGFGEGSPGRVYFFDTDSLDLLRQGVIVRVRLGTHNDITVKVRPPKDNSRVNESQLRQQFGCEIDRTRAAAITSFAVRRRYKGTTVPAIGIDIVGLLDASQKQLLSEAGPSIDWARVTRIIDISSTTWESAAESTTGKLSLELWEWPAGKILELSAKAESDAEVSKSAELERLVKTSSLSLSDRQDNKTSIALETVGTHAPSLR